MVQYVDATDEWVSKEDNGIDDIHIVDKIDTSSDRFIIDGEKVGEIDNIDEADEVKLSGLSDSYINMDVTIDADPVEYIDVDRDKVDGIELDINVTGDASTGEDKDHNGVVANASSDSVDDNEDDDDNDEDIDEVVKNDKDDDIWNGDNDNDGGEDE